MKSIRAWVEAATVLFHIREINWLILLWSSYVVPSMVKYGLDINQRIMPYQSFSDVISPLEWARLPSCLIFFFGAFYSVYRFIRNETDTCMSIVSLINIIKKSNQEV